jgi:hypothetical protein
MYEHNEARINKWLVPLKFKPKIHTKKIDRTFLYFITTPSISHGIQIHCTDCQTNTAGRDPFHIVSKNLTHDMSEWEFVKPKKRKQQKQQKPGSHGEAASKTHQAKNSRVSQEKLDRAIYLSSTDDTERNDDTIDLSSLISQVTLARQAIRTTSFYAECLSGLQMSLAAKGGVLFSSAVLLGLGKFSHSRAMPCILQLALALELLAEPTLFLGGDNSYSAYIFDPVMTPLDAELCSALGLAVMTEESVHLQPVSEHGRTLFYMPHCPYLLYNLVLWTNWDPRHLLRLVILGNSFDSYNTRHLGRSAAPADWDCVQILAEILSEQPVWQRQRRGGGGRGGAGSVAAHQPCLAHMENAFNDIR